MRDRRRLATLDPPLTDGVHLIQYRGWASSYLVDRAFRCTSSGTLELSLKIRNGEFYTKKKKKIIFY